MILTPNIAIDNDHMNAFQNEFEIYNSIEGETTNHWGSGELETCDIIIKKIRTPQGNGMYVAVSNGREGIFICRLIAAPVVQGTLPWGRKIYVMDKIMVHADYVGRGLAPAVYTWLADNGYTIMSDSHQTQTSLAVWKKLAFGGKVFMVDIGTERPSWRPYDPMKTEDWVVFGNGNFVDYWPVRFVLPAKT
jgi:GNAT superfamily N-acetyltransferase